MFVNRPKSEAEHCYFLHLIFRAVAYVDRIFPLNAVEEWRIEKQVASSLLFALRTRRIL